MTRDFVRFSAQTHHTWDEMRILIVSLARCALELGLFHFELFEFTWAYAYAFVILFVYLLKMLRTEKH